MDYWKTAVFDRDEESTLPELSEEEKEELRTHFRATEALIEKTRPPTKEGPLPESTKLAPAHLYKRAIEALTAKPTERDGP